MSFRSLLWMSVFLFAGCANTNHDYTVQLQSKDTKVSTFSSLSVQEMKESEPFMVHLGNEHHEVIMQNKKRVFASKLQLPHMDKPYSLDIISSSASGFFAPKIYFLNQNHKVTRIVSAKDLTFDRGYFKGTIFVNSEFDRDHFLVVTQDLNELHTQHKINYVTATQVAVPIYTGTGVYTYFYTVSSGDQNKTVKNATGGNIKLTLKVYKPKILGDEE